MQQGTGLWLFHPMEEKKNRKESRKAGWEREEKGREEERGGGKEGLGREGVKRSRRRGQERKGEGRIGKTGEMVKRRNTSERIGVQVP